MQDGAYVVHTTKERVRMKIPSRKRDADYFLALRDSLSRIEGVESVETNHVTASVLIIHKTTADAIIDFGRTNNLFTIRRASRGQTMLHKTVTGSFNSLNSKIRQLTDNAVDGSGIAFLLLAGLGIYQISRGNLTAPAWYTALWYATNIFLKGNKSDSEESLET